MPPRRTRIGLEPSPTWDAGMVPAEDVDLLSDAALGHLLVDSTGELAVPWDLALLLRDIQEREEREEELRRLLPPWITPNDLEVLLDVLDRAALPKRTPLKLRVRASRVPGDAGFTMTAEWTGAGDRRIQDHPSVTGGLLFWQGEWRRLSSGQARVIDTLATIGPLGGDRQRDQLAVARLQSSIPAGDPGVTLDPFLARNPVSAISAVKPHLDPVPGGYQVLPRFGAAEAAEADDYYFRTPRSRLGKDPISTRAPEGGTHRAVFTPDAEAALRRCRELDVISPSEAAHALSHPQEFFGPDLDTSEFYERVVGLGPYVARPVPTLREIQQGGWYDWDAEVTLDAVDVDESSPDPSDRPSSLDLKNPEIRETLAASLQRAEEQGDRFVPNPVGEGLMEVTPALRAAVQAASELAEASERDGGRLRRPVQEVLLVKENLESLRFGRAELPPLAPPVDLGRPPGLNPSYELHRYQVEGYGWLVRLYQLASEPGRGSQGALLADDMGLGKTLQAMAFLAWAKQHGRGGPHLLVGPVGLLDNWQREAQKFFGAHLEPIHLVTGSELPKDVAVAVKRLDAQHLVLVSYETLRRYEQIFARVDWDTVILDEAQKAKSPGSQIARVVRTLKARLRIAVTGTPVENTLKELWTIYDWATPGLLGPLRTFVDEYMRPLQSADEKRRAELAAQVQARIAPVFTRRLKEQELAHLPPITWHPQHFDLSPEQEDRYGGLLASVGQGASLGLLTHLFGVCAHPALGRSDAGELPPFDAYAFPRQERLLALLDDIRARGEKAIVFAKWRRLHEWLCRELGNRYGIRVPSINGTVTSSRRRMGIIDEFSNAEGFGVIVLAPRAAGVGLNITAANHVIHYTREWNPAVENQATDRAYRLGQTRPVHVHTFTAVSRRGTTVEERLHQLLEEKRALMKDFVVPMGSFEIAPDQLLADSGHRERFDRSISSGGIVP